MTQVTISIVKVSFRDDDEARVWDVRGRIVDIERSTPKKPLGHDNGFSVAKTIRQLVDIEFKTRVPTGNKDRVLLPNVTLRTGNLATVNLTDVDLEGVLNLVDRGDEDRSVYHATVDNIYPMRVPCVRVPLTLLEELRGPHERADQSRKALIETWKNDRRTGVPKGRNYRVR